MIFFSFDLFAATIQIVIIAFAGQEFCRFCVGSD
jgi:hypothetical protein